ncbi:Bol3 protein [Saccharomycopsis crataegensis]|uniref:Bol3 protein n=1 Tax=Saccharomycopsis crataegensis TaxID=43959 RepID=A0AAV5QNT2_9ASCO|nr:Bol3 protein [Saccharomycopsis crataegensis]
MSSIFRSCLYLTQRSIIAKPSTTSPLRMVPGSTLRSAVSHRSYSVNSQSVAPMDDYESKIFQLLNDKFDPVQLQVSDVSGGCGSMFAISIVSDSFKGISMVKQHRMVNETLAEEIKKWHGLQLVTKAPRK